MSETATEIRLIHEGATVCLGVLYHEDCHLECDGQDVRVEVWYGSGIDEGLHGGWYRVVVPMISPEGLSEDEQMEIHPATMAEVIVTAELQKDAHTFGWDDWEIADIRAF